MKQLLLITLLTSGAAYAAAPAASSAHEKDTKAVAQSDEDAPWKNDEERKARLVECFIGLQDYLESIGHVTSGTLPENYSKLGAAWLKQQPEFTYTKAKAWFTELFLLSAHTNNLRFDYQGAARMAIYKLLETHLI